MIDKLLIIEFEKIGIEKIHYFKFKLYNSNAYNKMISQAQISKKIAIDIYKKKMVADEEGVPQTSITVKDKNGSVIGKASIRHNKGYTYILGIDVNENMRRKGIGTKIIDYIKKNYGENIDYSPDSPEGMAFFDTIKPTQAPDTGSPKLARVIRGYNMIKFVKGFKGFYGITIGKFFIDFFTINQFKITIYNYKSKKFIFSFKIKNNFLSINEFIIGKNYYSLKIV